MSQEALAIGIKTEEETALQIATYEKLSSA
jgi:hypothetical protein